MMKPLSLQDMHEVLELVSPHWDELRNARLLLTGCTGFVGTWLLESLLHAQDRLNLNTEILVLTRDIPRFHERMPHIAQHPSLRLLEGDVRSVEVQGRLTHIIHGAASPGPDWQKNPPEELVDTIVQGTTHMLTLADRCGVERFLHLSSGAVYGPQPPSLDLLPETFPGAPDPLAPDAGYALAKRLAEHLCALANTRRNIPCISARCFSFLAPHLQMKAHFAAGNFIGQGLNRETILVSGDGTPMRSYLYGTDLAAWLWSLLIAGEPGKAYNVGSERAVSIGELANAVAQQAGVAVRVAKTPAPGTLPPRYIPSTKLGRHELGLRETVDLEEAIRRTLAWASPLR